MNKLISTLLTDRTTGNLLVSDLTGIVPRFKKSKDQKTSRTKEHAEVFTPTWIVNNMTSEFDSELTTTNTVLEITCGEAPFLTTRYEPDTGTKIPLESRCGLLDKKLRLIKGDFYKGAIDCFKSVYGYELNTDSLVIARVNLLLTFIENYRETYESGPTLHELSVIATIISWNLWRMNGLGDTHKLIYNWKENRRCYFDE